MRKTRLGFCLLLAITFHLEAQQCDSTRCWRISDLLQVSSDSVVIEGNPEIVPSPYGDAVHFNGSSDGIILSRNLLEGLSHYTVEVIVSPDSNGAREQRFLHFGELRGDRTLLEIRLQEKRWVLDAYVKSGDSAKTLIDYSKTHPVENWHHIALSVSCDSVIAYINGVKELEDAFSPLLQRSGKTSIGVRLNKQYWFKGSIALLSIAPSALKPHQFKLLTTH